ncbi:preprotein translocase subunit SecY [Egibacter rhizosphaerae]|uniref:Protein translocase subunit SecY n=1 Tax=Egibacter rhizosphaerae TaxID=1670831 RepID=A0A411YH82_9ACTN|nr:preprotein translocase subunit SecY [Egibacter rhizosphaerae]QBI20469.1 preprotein translocase subunit SecY [Egibacter rhizosphaerae]
MLRAFANAFKIPDLRGKIFFTIAIIAVYRLGAHIPTPGVDFATLQGFLAGAQAEGPGQLVNLFSGGAFNQLSVFALGIMPYITASIIMQLLTVVIPKVEEWKKEGETGQKKINQWTRYLTVALALVQSTGLIVMIGQGNLLGFGQLPAGITLIPEDSIPLRALMILTMTAGTALIMYLGELISQRGVGNGMSLIIFSAIVSEIPNQGNAILQAAGEMVFAVAVAVGLLLIVAVVFVELGQRRIPVEYAKRQVGRRTYGGSQTYIPLKVNQSGVIPIIFASSILFIPSLTTGLIDNPAFTQFVERHLNPENPSFWFIAVYFGMTMFFAFFYTAITFNPQDVADNMKKYGGFIPGIRPGKPTADYLDYVLTRITSAGSIYLSIIAVLPLIVAAAAGLPFPFGGAMLLIVVGVGLNTMRQIESQLLQRDYEGFIRS